MSRGGYWPCINTSILTRSGGSNGIGFAIPSDLVAQYVRQAEEGATDFARPWSGIDVQPVDADLAEALGLPGPRGVAIRELHPESPFAKAGLIPGDVLTELSGRSIDGPQELDYRLAVLGPGSKADIRYWRDGAEATASIALTEAPGMAVETVSMPAGTIFAGLTVAPLGPALIDRLGLPLTAEGVVVTEVAGPARRTRLRPGDILLAVNGTPIATPDDLISVTAAGGTSWRLDVQRGSQRAVIRLSGR